MPFKLLKLLRHCITVCVRWLARVAGYVPAREVAEVHLVVSELRYRVQCLETQITQRDHLAREIALLRASAALHSTHGSDTQKAVDRLDVISTNLLNMMRDVWPEAHSVAEAEIQPVP